MCLLLSLLLSWNSYNVRLVHLTSQRSLVFFFPSFFFSCSAWVISTTLSSSLLICYSVLSYCWFPPVYLFLSVIIFSNSVWFFIFSNSLLETNFSLCSSVLLPSAWAFSWPLPWTLYQVGCLSPLSSSSGAFFYSFWDIPFCCLIQSLSLCTW